MSAPDEAPSPRGTDRLLFAGLAGMSVAVVLQLLDKQPDFTKVLGFALVCFAVALPILVSSFVLEVAVPNKEKRAGRRAFDLAGVLLSLVGLGLVFFHMHIVASCAFVAAVAFCAVVMVRWLR
jgi:hypothetical protein